MVSAAILESVREAIAYLEIQDASRAAAQLTGLVDVIRQIPASTAEAVGLDKVSKLADDLKWASEVNTEQALRKLWEVLMNWCEEVSTQHPA
jgi:hypothetical protein